MSRRTMQVLPPPSSPRRSAAYQLTPLWERVVRTRRLPAEVDLPEAFEALKRRLRDPEREVRQHALRVLADLVPVVPSLDTRMVPLLPELSHNLGHPAPAVRKGALDALRIYLANSDNRESILSDICSKCPEQISTEDIREDVVTGMIIALPSLLLTTIRHSEEPGHVISAVIKSLSSKLLQKDYKDLAARSLLKIEQSIGTEEFERHLAGSTTTFRSLTLSSKSELEASITVDVEDKKRTHSGKIILETEFAFDKDTAITMTVLEEDPGAQLSIESEDDSFDYSTYNKSLMRVLTDSEQDEIEAKKTSRRVRFGGEVVKMRTPDSDDIQNAESDTASIDKLDEKKKPRSMIPLPTLPSKSVPKPRRITEIDKTKSKSLDDLSEYCKVRFRSIPSKESFDEVDKKNSDEDSVEHYPIPIPRSPVLSPRRLLRKTLESKGFPVDDLSSGPSGNSSTGSGSSSDNTYEDFFTEGVGVFQNETFKDLFKVGDERAVVQALERLTREVNTSAATAYATEPYLGALATRLASLGARGRTGIATSGLLRALLRGVRPMALKNALPRIAGALAVQTTRGANLTADLARRLQPEEIIDILLNTSGPHWRSSKLRAGALRVVSHLGNIAKAPGGVSGSIGSKAARAAASSCRHPRRRVRAAALDALAALAHLATPRSVLAALHHEAADRNDGDQLYDAVFARLCRNEAETRRPTGAHRGGPRGAGGAETRPDLAWVMAGSNSASPPSAHKHGRRLETGWTRSAPDLPALIAAGNGPHFSFSASRKTERDKVDKNMNGLIEARVLTAPSTGVTLRPLVFHQVQNTNWPRQGLVWPQQPAPPWTQNTAWAQQQQKQSATWSPLSSSWSGGVGGNGNVGGGGSWPQRRPPAQLRALTPPPNRPRLEPLTSPRSASNWNISRDDDDDVTSLNRNEETNEDHHQYKVEELDDISTLKSDIKSLNEDTISSHNSPVSNESRWRANNNQETASAHSRVLPSQDSNDDEVQDEPDQNPMYENINLPPTIEDEFEDEDKMQNYEEQRVKTPSTTEIRFINNIHEVEEVQSQHLNEYINEERFINLKSESPHPEPEIIIEKLGLDKKSPTHSVHSQFTPNSEREVENVRANVNSAPAITFMGSLVNSEEEVKSVDSVFSDHCVENIEVEVVEKPIIEPDTQVLGNKISPIKKTPKRTLPKALSSKFIRNKIQPSVDEPSPIKTTLPFEKPKEALNKSLIQLENSDWEIVMTGLQNMGRLIKCHPALMETQLTTASRAVAQQVKNLRSQVARSACRLAGEMFEAHKKGMEPDADELATPLLHRTADTNKFLRNDANNALDKMCESISAQKTLCILMTRGAVHQNAVVRCTSARLLAIVVKNSGFEKIFSFQKEIRDKLFQTGADLLMEGSQETRAHAKKLFTVLAQSNYFTRTVREVIPLSKYRNIEKTINSLKK